MSVPIMGETEPAADAANVETPQKPKPRTILEIMNSHLDALRANHRSVLEAEDVEAIHKFRVTTRRLQAVLDTLQTGDQRTRVLNIKRRLRRWRRQLSTVRNYDVFIELLEREA